MTFGISRRRFLTTTAAAAATLAVGRPALAQDTTITPDTTGGIGWPRQPFEDRYGQGTEYDDLIVYPNPYLDGSHLSVMYRDGVAIFIDMLIPADANVDPVDGPSLLQNLLPDDATSIASWNIPDVGAEVPYWVFEEFNAPSMNMAGSGATRMQTCTATVDGSRLVRATVSLAIPGGASQFAPAEGSIGVGASGSTWQEAHGQGHGGEGAAGTYSAHFDIEPWNDVLVLSQRTEGSDTKVITINAISYEGVNVDNAMAFAESILPQGAQLQAAYEAFAVEDRPQGWGTSTWAISENELVLLFMLGAGNESGDVLQVASALYTMY